MFFFECFDLINNKNKVNRTKIKWKIFARKKRELKVLYLYPFCTLFSPPHLCMQLDIKKELLTHSIRLVKGFYRVRTSLGLTLFKLAGSCTLVINGERPG